MHILLHTQSFLVQAEHQWLTPVILAAVGGRDQEDHNFKLV
jgi:hypothetical protein